MIPALLLLLLATLLLLRLMGRHWWCDEGDLSLFSWEVNGPHNSQHLIDWYTFSHFEHGLLFFLILSWLFSNHSYSFWLLCAFILECGWEVLENSPFVIERYRTATAAFGYVGDSIANSMADIFFCYLGFIAASKMSTRRALLLFLLLELFTLILIRDNLFLNVLMLLWPISGIQRWQLGAIESL